MVTINVVKQGSKVTLDYEGKFEDGVVFDSSKHGDHSHPLIFTVGNREVIEGFEKAALGMKQGQEKEFSINPKEAYGEYNPELKKEIPLEAIPKNQIPKKGMTLMLGGPDGRQFPAKVADVTKKNIVIDLNHPLAGKKLIFKIKIIGVEN